MSAIAYPHIELDTEGIPWVAGTKTKVVEIVLDRLAYHWDAGEMHRQHRHLSLAQIYSALAYYYDHQAEVDQDIERRWQYAEEVKQRLGESPIKVKLMQLKRKS